MQEAGHISDLKLQPRWVFPINGEPLMSGSRAARYTADFGYLDNLTGQPVVEDVKGVLMPDAALRIALMWSVHRVRVQLIGRQRKGRPRR